MPDVEDEFYIELSEVFDNGDRSMNWKLRTIEPVDCEGASISFSFKREAGQVLSLSINEILAPNDCDPAEEPARAVVEVGVLETGPYPVSVALRETLNQDGVLKVYDQFYQLELESGNGIIPLRDRLYRIPDHTIWGFIDHQGIESLILAADAFMSELTQITEEQTLTNGHYGYFGVADNGRQITFPDDEAMPLATTYRFQRAISPDQKTEVTALISTYRENYEGLVVKVFNTFGEEW